MCYCILKSQRATNELCGSCLKVYDGADDWGCLYYQQWLIYAICPLHGAKYKLNNIMHCPVGVLFYASCIILAQQKLLVASDNQM